MTARLFPFVNEIFWFFQRGWRGYSDSDVWSIDFYLDRIMPDMLRQLQKEKHGCPNECCEMADGDVDRGCEIWDEILQKIIEGFESHLRIMEHDYVGSVEEETLQERHRIGMELFIKHYSDLWD